MLPVHRERARLWQQLSGPESERPMIWINEICWHEVNFNDELTLRTEKPWAPEQERDLRRTLYQWRHPPEDMIVSDYLSCPLAFHRTDLGSRIPLFLPATHGTRSGLGQTCGSSLRRPRASGMWS